MFLINLHPFIKRLLIKLNMRLFILLLCVLAGSLDLTAQRRVHNALHFDGINDVVRCKADKSTELAGSALTVEAWVQPTDFQSSSQEGIIMCRYNESMNRGFALSAGGSGQVYFGIFDDSSAEITTAANTLTKNTWTHIAATFDRYQLRVYINGTLVASLIDSTAVGNTGTLPLTLGNLHSLSRPWWGQLEEVKLWSRALSASEISQNYQRSYCGFSKDLRAYYRFDRGTALGNNSVFFRIPDWSGFNNEGTLYNFQMSGSTSNYVAGLRLTQSAIATVDTVYACERYANPSRTNTWFQSGTYADTVYSKRGCDSALNIVLFIKKSTRDTLYVRSCGNYMFPSGKQSTSVSGVFTDNLINSVGCDSLLTLIVKVGPDTTLLEATACHRFILPFSKRIISRSGEFTDTLKNRYGCDSMVFYTVNIKPQSLRQVTLELCDSVKLSGSGRWVFQSGMYTDTGVNFRGCDSIINYNVKSLVTRSFYQDYACGTYLSPSGRYIWTQSGVWNDTLINKRGCDSIIQIDLILSPNSETVLKVQACRQFRVPSRRYTITSSGTYFDTIMNAYGCDSVIRIEANITWFENALVSNSNTLKAQQGYSNYQWLRCDKSFEVVPNETKFELVVKEPGDYAVRMEENGCVDTSECVNIAQNGASIFQNVKLNVYPNPSGGRVFIAGENLDACYVEVLDLNNRVIQVISFMNGYDGPQYIDIAQKGWFYLILIKDKYREAVPILIE